MSYKIMQKVVPIIAGVRSDKVVKFEEDIGKMIYEGWLPAGGVNVVYQKSPFTGSEHMILNQAMYRPSNIHDDLE